jgi:enterochelin esterase family protein
LRFLTPTRAYYFAKDVPHGEGENEQGWHTQGHADLILDNLIAEKKARPMIIVMDNLNAVRSGEDAGAYHALSIIARRSAADMPPPVGAPPRSTVGSGTTAPAARPGFPANWFNMFH